MNEAILKGLAEVLEVEAVTPATVLAEAGAWDSLAIVATMALLDDVAGVQTTGAKLAACRTVADVLALAGVAP